MVDEDGGGRWRAWRDAANERWKRWRHAAWKEWQAWKYEAKALRRDAADAWRARWWPRLRRGMLWAQLVGGWSLVAWAVADAVPTRWESVAWKAAAGLLLLATVGGEMWRALVGVGTYLLSEIDREEGGGP